MIIIFSRRRRSLVQYHDLNPGRTKVIGVDIFLFLLLLLLFLYATPYTCDRTTREEKPARFLTVKLKFAPEFSRASILSNSTARSIFTGWFSRDCRSLFFFLQRVERGEPRKVAAAMHTAPILFRAASEAPWASVEHMLRSRGEKGDCGYVASGVLDTSWSSRHSYLSSGAVTKKGSLGATPPPRVGHHFFPVGPDVHDHREWGYPVVEPGGYSKIHLAAHC